MTANITIYTKEDSNALLISVRATKFKPDSTIMRKYKTDNQQRKIKGELTASGPDAGDRPNRNYKNKMDSTAKDSSNLKRASVWILNGDTLTRRFIRIGLEDGTKVQVLSGLSPGDEVVDAVQRTATKGNPTATQRSPFMPQRRNAGQGNNRPTGGAGGNGPSR